MRDVVVVGAGVAGLAAAWRLRHRDVVVLDAAARVGGRLRSERRGAHWLNWGGHVFAGGDSATARLLQEAGVVSVPVPGSLAGLALNGRLLLGGRVETYPFRVPMDRAARLAVVTAGARVRLAVARYARVVRLRAGESEATRQQRVYEFMNNRSFAAFVGDLPPDARALFEPTVTRSSGEMDEISAGAGIGYFNLVWNLGAGLSQNILGGPATLTGALAAAVGDRVWLGATVREVVQRRGSVVVRHVRDGREAELEARCVVLATPAGVSHAVGVDLDPDVRDALAAVRYGPYVSAAFLTGETNRQRWDDAYAIATPKRSFTVALNMSNVVHGRARERVPGGSWMVFSPAGQARRLLDEDDDTVRARYLADLDTVLPGVAEHVVESGVARWPTGAPYCFPGRAALQPALTRAGSRVLLAGDYLGTLYTETAIASGLTAAQHAHSLLAAHPSPAPAPIGDPS